ncbi:MAG: dihydrodipicolinate synthase family protein [Niabella sp.]|nr:dihydrodipicolinate synthase family protein [Niabella sp.]
MKLDTTKKKIIVPAITPLTPAFNIDEAAVEAMFTNFYAHGVLPFILGTTGEAPSLPMRQKRDYLVAASKYKKAGTALYAGISSNIIDESVEFAKCCADYGVDAVAATLPTYYTLTETQMQRYFEQLADAIPLPLIIYNIPATTHMSIPLAVIDALSHHPNIIATKDSERSDERLQESLQLWKDRNDFAHYLGWAARSVVALIGGSKGLIPSTGNIFPGIYQRMLQAVATGDTAVAHEMQQQSDEGGALYQSGRTLGESLWALKVLMHEKGLCQPVVMPPLLPQDETQAEDLKKTLSKIQFT